MNPPGLAIGAPPIGCSVRAASRDDLPQVIRLLESARANQDLHLDLADVVADLGADDLTVVAAVENDVVGALIGRLEGETGRILAIVVAPEWRDRRIGASLIEYAESQLFGRGARKVTALIADGASGRSALRSEDLKQSAVSRSTRRRSRSNRQRCLCSTDGAVSLYRPNGGTNSPGCERNERSSTSGSSHRCSNRTSPSGLALCPRPRCCSSALPVLARRHSRKQSPAGWAGRLWRSFRRSSGPKGLR